MKADPANGVWFLGPDAGNGLGPKRFYHLVCAHQDEDGTCVAMLFCRPVLTRPASGSAGNRAERWFKENAEWLRSSLESGEDVVDWTDPPQDFFLFISPKPGESEEFVRRSPSEETYAMVGKAALGLGEIWPEWAEWRARQNAPAEVDPSRIADDDRRA